MRSRALDLYFQSCLNTSAPRPPQTFLKLILTPAQVRERVLSLLDKDTFREVGSVSGTVTWKTIPGTTREEPVSYVPSNNVQGFGLLNGRKVVFTADDFSIRAGHADGALMEKTIYMEKLAVALKLPIVKLVDGSSGGGRYVGICS
jgi:acetyl-CoA carboxylase carboxyltransferase component